MTDAPITKPGTTGFFISHGQGIGELHPAGGKSRYLMAFGASQPLSTTGNPLPLMAITAIAACLQTCISTESSLLKGKLQTQNA
jgi:hypothetical protein